MPEIRYRVLAFLGLMAACCLLCHCSIRPPGALTPGGDLIDPQARRLLEAVLAANQDLESIKGIGRVKLLLDNQQDTFRAVWGGRQPDLFRLDVLVLTGQPFLSFASDGDRIYLLSYSENKLYRRKATGSGLKRIISIDITVSDFLDLISGRIPAELQQESRVRLEEDEGSGPRLVLYGGGREYIDTIFLDVDRSTVREFERRERSGGLLYRVVFETWGETDGFRLPEIITIQDDGGRMIRLDVARTWVNPVLTDEQFVLKAL